MLRSSLHLPNFRWLWLGQTFLLCASQFWFVALTWLVLQKTNSGMALGTVLMAAAIPRGLLMLMGGAVSDRFSPKVVVTTAAIVNTSLVGLVTFLLFAKGFYLPGTIATAMLFGCSEAFLYPALLALLPQIISRSHLAQANAWMQGGEQITNVVGPAAAGVTIGMLGLPIAFGLNALLFAVGSGCMMLLRVRSPLPRPGSSTLTKEILEGIRHAWQNPAIRISLLMIAMINFAVLGPIVIGVAELVNVRFGSHAATFGYLQAAYGVGAFLGVLIASRLSAITNLRSPLIWLSYGIGAGLMLLGVAQQAWMAAGILMLMGIGSGIIGVLGLTWLQQQTAKPMQGRMMSLVMFAAVALDPLSQAISGMLLEVNLTGLFVLAGMTMFGTAIVSSWGNDQQA
jgi:MFS family permease